MSYIRWFNEISAGDVELVGGKGANLGEMTSAKLPVPPGFCLTAQAYQDFIEITGLTKPIQKIIAGMQEEDPSDIDSCATAIRDLITRQEVPPILHEKIIDSYHQLDAALGGTGVGNAPVAVRSSATAEDLPTASFAGQQDTYLNVRGDEQLIETVKSCWASLWTTRAVTYRTKQGFDHNCVYLAVVVQLMIQSETAGILFTADPITGNRDEAVINASWGLGEAIVSGLVTPDTIKMRKDDGQLLLQEIACKDRMITYLDDGGTAEIDTPDTMCEVPALSNQQLERLVDIGCEVERHYGSPQDIEWAYYKDQFYVLQSRPITTLDAISEATIGDQEYNRTMFREIFPDPLSPVFLSAIVPLLESMLDYTFETLGFTPQKDMDGAVSFYNQPYFNRNYIEAAFKPLPPSIREHVVAQVVNPFGDHKQGSMLELSPTYLRMVVRMLRFMIRFPKQLPNLLQKYHDDIDEINSLPLETVSDEEIVARIETLVYGIAGDLLNNDFLLIDSSNRTYRLLASMLEPTFGDETEEVCAKLISGVTGNVTMETNKQIWDLSQVAKASPVVSDILRKYDEREVRDHLEGTPDGQEFLEKLDRFLDEYGHRELRMSILFPTWGEDPTPVLGFIRAYLDADETQSPYHQQTRLASEREELTEKVFAAVESDFKGRYVVSPFFRWLLNLAQVHTRERDTMHFELTRLFPPFRRMLNVLSDRWCKRGILAHESDIFYLTLDELIELAETPRTMNEVVEERREEFELNKTRHWPDIIRNGQEIYGDTAQPVEITDGAMTGIAGSPGVVTGTARVIRGPEEFDQLKKGEILVSPITNPVWTPLFAVASAVIAEVGGILSHGAIVAREYGIPAVMSVTGATQLISDGQEITVDGNLGLVRLEDGGVS
ncbi:MAG: hypothetical protein GTO18_14105 [Anaerolineales bacterium]|nr:hypothetical protein [Anaerolineales bacterium]